MKKIIKVLCTMLIFIFILSACVKSEDPTPLTPIDPPTENRIQESQVDGITNWVATSYENIFKEDKSNNIKKVNLLMAKNEYESVQLVVNGEFDFELIGMEFEDLLGSTASNRLGKENISYNYVGYEYFSANSPNQNADSAIKLAPNYFPDRLLSVDRLTIDQDITQSIWLRFHTPEETVADTYTGRVLLKTDKGNISADVSIEVANVTIPNGADAEYSLTFWQHIIYATTGKYTQDSKPNDLIEGLVGDKRYSEAWWKFVDKFASMMKQYRLNYVYIPTVHLLVDGGSYQKEDGSYHFDWSRFDEYIGYFMDKGFIKGIYGYNMATAEANVYYYVGKTSDNVPRYDSAGFADASNKKMTEHANKWFDEYLKALNEHLVEKGWDKIFRQAIMDEPMSSAALSRYRLLHDTIRDKAPNIKVGDPHDASATSTLADLGIDLYIPRVDTHTDSMDVYKGLAQGKEVWTYSCSHPQGTYLNRFIDKALWEGRSIAWYNYHVGATGFLHWGLMAWYRPISDFGLGDTASIYQDKENKTFDISIRLEALSDGAEEFELLKILEKKDPLSAKQLAEYYAEDARSNYLRDFHEMQEIREALIRLAAS